MKKAVFTYVAIVLFAASCGGPADRDKLDAGRRDSGATSDAPAFGQNCEVSSDCPDGGYCVEGFGAKVCTYACEVGCPTGWQCRGTKVDGSIVSVCVPPEFNLCSPCASDSQCGDGVCVTLGGAPYCLPNCPFEGQCPQGYQCLPDPSGQHQGNYCVPQTGGCTCTTGADDGLVRTCTNTNAIGSCQGLETCRPSQGGWVGCNAPAATQEVCDGIDNDCNMLVDDGLASGQPCAITVAGIGTCPGVTLCTGTSGVVCQGPTPKVETCNYTDDDCDTSVDEGFPGVNTVCSAGIGACERFGVVRCNAAGTGTECSAVAGASTNELCNGLDDNCDGSTDENFPNKGATCTVGTGICQRQGNYVCNASGTGLDCSVTPGTPAAMESCNSLDDDCDTKIDEGFRDSNGVYNQDRACGSCAVDCTVLYGLPNAFGTCNAAISPPSCAFTCDPGAYNLDGATANGCEFILDPNAIYVSVNDPAANDDPGCGLGPVGTNLPGYYPCKSITYGLSRTTATRRKVLVANGIYNEAVTLINGRDLLGGYRPDNWVRDIAATGTLIVGVTSVGNHDRTVIASGITSATLFEGFVVYGSVNTKPTGNSYAIYVTSSSSSLVIRSNVVFGGRGGPGTNGLVGPDGPNGADGIGRSANLGSNDALYDAKNASGTGDCDASNTRQYANGGVTACSNGGDPVDGGSGGGNRCPAAATATCSGCQCNAFGCGCSSCNFVTQTPSNGFTGQPGAGVLGGAGGAGAARGEDMIYKTISGNSLCFIPSNSGGMALPTYGLNGANGVNAMHGTQAPGCSATSGSISGSEWVGTSAPNGVTGGNGGGGGGGGAGGGANCDGCQTAKDTLGGHGGGGGAGGCGGGFGGGAAAGGGAFGIFIVGGSAPIVTSNSIFLGEGGVGGAGGAGGKGGTGGIGALGGTTGVPVVFCTDVAGRGGNGGDGGHGSGGGGGCGGSTFGIYTSGIGAATYCGTNTFSGGSGGAGGPGGYSITFPGLPGTAGAATPCSIN